MCTCTCAFVSVVYALCMWVHAHACVCQLNVCMCVCVFCYDYVDIIVKILVPHLCNVNIITYTSTTTTPARLGGFTHVSLQGKILKNKYHIYNRCTHAITCSYIDCEIIFDSYTLLHTAVCNNRKHRHLQQFP